MTGREAEAMSERLKLTDREWRAFFIKDLFTISTGSIVPREQLAPGRMPRITATEQNNGVDSFTAPLEEKSFRTNADCLSISFLGAVFYQSNASSFDMKIHSLNLKNKTLGKRVGLFVATELRKQFAKFSYGNQLSSSTLLRQKFQLPSIDGSPDWNFMSAYMRQEEKVLMKEAISRLERQLAEKHAEPVAFKGREWRAFVFGKEFSISSTSSSIDRKKLSEGDSIYPYITRSDNQNGVDSFVCSQEGYKMDEGNVITIGLDTQTVFYQPSAFYTGQNIQVVRHPKLNRHNALFVIRAIKILVQKFSWGSYGATLTRLKRGRLYLPITPDGTPDWAFMSAYMQNIEREMLREALAYFKEKIR